MPGGRLLIVDFAPHELEYLRDQFAHERLGFSAAQVAQWLGDCGLDLLQRHDLAPASDAKGAKLTVSVWLAARPQLVGPLRDGAGRRNLEQVR